METTGGKDILRFAYHFDFENGSTKNFEIFLDESTLDLISTDGAIPPAWTALQYYPCENCPLPPTVQFCPVAVNLAKLVGEFQDSISYEQTLVTVECPERRYVKETTLQKALSSIIGIYMTTSGCPVMDKLRPMTRFHLPFANSAETLYRVVSMYVTAQFLRERAGLKADWSLEKLVESYKAISLVNRGISKRLADASNKDANVNAVVILHSIGDLVPYFIEHGMEELEHLFAMYMDGRCGRFGEPHQGDQG